MKIGILEKKEHLKKYKDRRFQEEAEKEGIELKLMAPRILRSS